MRLSAPWQTRCYVGILLCTFAASVFALNLEKAITAYCHRGWGAADGLDRVYSIGQTTDGYIWVGAANGLFRFDGFHFKQWEPGPNEPKLPAHASLLRGTKDGSLWIASFGHMLRLKDGRMTDFPLPGATLSRALADRIQERRDGTLWVPTGFGLFEFVDSK